MPTVSMRARVGLALTSLVTLGLTPLAVQSADAVSAEAATPHIRAVITKSGVEYSGPVRFRPGYVDLTAVGRKAGGGMELVRFRGDYTFHHFRQDIGKVFAGGDNALTALNRAIKHTRFYGAPSSDAGETHSGTAFLDRPGTYVMFLFGDAGPVEPLRLHVHGTRAHRPAPSAAATVVATENRRWGGDDVLPADGAVRLVNRADFSPHFVELQHVAKGTTRKEVIDCLQDEANCTFDFGRAGSAATGSLSPNHRFVFEYSLPRGTYALMCFFPDPETGMPHAVMGMVKIVTLR